MRREVSNPCFVSIIALVDCWVIEGREGGAEGRKKAHVVVSTLGVRCDVMRTIVLLLIIGVARLPLLVHCSPWTIELIRIVGVLEGRNT